MFVLKTFLNFPGSNPVGEVRILMLWIRVRKDWNLMAESGIMSDPDLNLKITALEVTLPLKRA